MSYYLLLLLFVTEPEQAYLLSRIPLLASTLPTPSFHAFSMSRAAAAVVAACGFSVLGYRYSMAPPAQAQAKLTPEQHKTRMLRSHLSGHNPVVSGGNDCLSRKQGQIRSHQSGDHTEGEKDRRTALNGTVSMY